MIWSKCRTVSASRSGAPRRTGRAGAGDRHPPGSRYGPSRRSRTGWRRRHHRGPVFRSVGRAAVGAALSSEAVADIVKQHVSPLRPRSRAVLRPHPASRVPDQRRRGGRLGVQADGGQPAQVGGYPPWLRAPRRSVQGSCGRGFCERRPDAAAAMGSATSAGSTLSICRVIWRSWDFCVGLAQKVPAAFGLRRSRRIAWLGGSGYGISVNGRYSQVAWQPLSIPLTCLSPSSGLRGPATRPGNIFSLFQFVAALLRCGNRSLISQRYLAIG